MRGIGILSSIPKNPKPPNAPNHQLSNEKNLGFLGYIGDEKLPSYIGIVISHYKDPGTLTNQDDSWKVGDPGFFGLWLNLPLVD